MRYAGLFTLGLLLFLSILYLTSFGLMCVFISTGSTRVWLRRVLDTIAALISLPLFGYLWLQTAPLLGNPSVSLLSLPCITGAAFGGLYAFARRFSLR